MYVIVLGAFFIYEGVICLRGVRRVVILIVGYLDVDVSIVF